MSLHEQIAFIKKIPPFDNLKGSQLDSFVKNLDIVYLKKGVILQKQKDEPKNLYFIIKGLIQEKHNDEVISIYSNGEFFDTISLIENRSKNSFITIEESICYTLPRDIFIKVLHENEALESFFFQSISQKLNSNISSEKNRELANLMVAKVKDAKVHRAVIVPFETSIYQAVKTIKKEKVPTLLLEDKNKNIHIVTDSDFREKVILNRMDFDEVVGKISNSNLKYINENDFLFNAQLLMSKYSLKRLVVKNNENKIVGIIDQISISSFFATHTFLISNEIDNAKDITELKKATQALNKIVKALYAKGVKVDFISKLVNQLNRKIMHKLFLMLAPSTLLNSSALVVMGSEGRGEQILKTDQDNALIIADNCTCSNKEIEEFTKNYTNTLVDFGFPRCQGNIMVSNPYWCRRFKDFKDQIYEWIMKPQSDSFMNLAIFYDSFCVCGNRELLDDLKEYLFKIGSTSKSFYMHFAKVVMDFEVPLGFFDGFIFNSNDKEHKNEIDIKRGGIFIIVHSLRTLSLEHNLLRVNTLKRVKELEKLGEFDREFASEITEAFNFLLTLKLKSNLNKLDRKEAINNYINPKDLTIMEKDLLKDSFKIVNRLKKKMEHHYKLNYV